MAASFEEGIVAMSIRLMIAAASMATLAVAGPASAQTSARAAAWYGDYSYEHYAGETAGGTRIFITYTLHLGDDGCRMQNDGYQTNEGLHCTARMEGNALRIGFRSYPDGSMRTNWGVQVYQPNERLLTLVRTRRGVETRWGAVSPEGRVPAVSLRRR